MPKAKIITGIDIGTSSIKALTCLKRPESPDLEVLAFAQEPSFGVRKGVVLNAENVSRNIYQVLEKIQTISGQKPDSCLVNIGGSHIFVTSSRGMVAVSRADQRISEEDVSRVVQAAQAFSLPSNKEILEVWPREFIVDGERGIKTAVGMQGGRLETEILALCAFSPYIKNLTEAVLNCGLQINDLLPSGLASARAILDSRQRELGVAVLDIGAGTSSLAVFEEGDLIHAACFPIGSSYITSDIAIGLRIDIDTAERIKKEFGTCVYSRNKKDKIEIPHGEENPPLVFSRRMLVKIIAARVGEIFEEIDAELKKISKAGLLPAGIVLTGGGAKLPKIIEFAKKELCLPAKIGIPQGFVGLEEDPSLATVCGLVLQGVDIGENGGPPVFRKGVINRIKRLLKVFIP